MQNHCALPYKCSLIFGVFPNFIKTTFLLDNVKSSLILLRHLNYSCNIGITFVSFDIVVPGLSTFVLFLYLLILCCKPEYFLAALALPDCLSDCIMGQFRNSCDVLSFDIVTSANLSDWTKLLFKIAFRSLYCL